MIELTYAITQLEGDTEQVGKEEDMQVIAVVDYRPQRRSTVYLLDGANPRWRESLKGGRMMVGVKTVR